MEGTNASKRGDSLGNIGVMCIHQAAVLCNLGYRSVVMS